MRLRRERNRPLPPQRARLDRRAETAYGQMVPSPRMRASSIAPNTTIGEKSLDLMGLSFPRIDRRVLTEQSRRRDSKSLSRPSDVATSLGRRAPKNSLVEALTDQRRKNPCSIRVNRFGNVRSVHTTIDLNGLTEPETP